MTDKTKDGDNVVEVGGKKYTVTPEFKKDFEALNTKVTSLETDKKTLSQKLDELSKKPPANKKDDPPDDDDDDIPDEDYILKPKETVNKLVQRTVRKLGIRPGNSGDEEELLKKLELKMSQNRYFEDFYREHPYFDPDDHDDLVKIAVKKIMPEIKDMKLKEGRAKIAERVASMLGRKIKDKNLIVNTDSKSGTHQGVVLENADGSAVDTDGNRDNTKGQQNKTLAQISRERREAKGISGKKK
jgi:hypothetical protein